MNEFLPVTIDEMHARGWKQPDFLYVFGDAYVDHPSFGHAIISRVLERAGYKVAMLPQPNWKTAEDFKKFGRPRLGVLVSAGNLDSMVAHYTAAKKKRHDDMYSPGGAAGRRPDRAVIVYCNRIREAFGNIPLIIGGIEASLRRFAHYDYWDDRVRRSILFDSRADLLIYGMGERQTVEIARRLERGEDVKQIHDIAGTCFAAGAHIDVPGAVRLPSYEEVCKNKPAYASACAEQYRQQDPIRGKPLVQPHGDRVLVQLPPAMPLETEQFDKVYELPYARAYHPNYAAEGGVPAIEEVKFSLTSCRGCFGACNFCALTFHQGRIVQARSHESLLREAKQMTADPDFKGYIHDVGGPTADFRAPACRKQLKAGACADRQCLFPNPCPSLDASHADYLALLRKLRALPGVKKVFVRSGLRYDYILADRSGRFLRELCAHHVSGQLKVAPEHVSAGVLRHMGKPPREVYERFAQQFRTINGQLGKKQYLVPYLMSSHPGSTLQDAIELALFLKNHGMNPRQVQDFYPTPGTLSTAMFYTGIDPRTGKAVYVPRSPEDKAMQRALLQYKNPANHALVRKALARAGREDLIGFQRGCLVPPAGGSRENRYGAARKNNIKNGGKQYGNDFGRKGNLKKGKGGTGRRGQRAEGQGNSPLPGGNHRRG